MPLPVVIPAEDQIVRIEFGGMVSVKWSAEIYPILSDAYNSGAIIGFSHQGHLWRCRVTTLSVHIEQKEGESYSVFEVQAV